MDVSVIIVTRNRCRSLGGALEALMALAPGGPAFELIVADNGSTDATGDVCDSLGKYFPEFTYLYDPRPGQIVGWHKALAISRAPVLAFMDDDVRPHPGWLAGVADAFSDAQVGLATGPIKPVLEVEPPAWRKGMILAHEGGLWSAHWGLLDFGSDVKEVSPAFVWGRNFLVRRDAMIAAGGFHPGGMPARLFRFTGDGDMGLGKAVAAAGHKVLYHPEAAVENLFNAAQDEAAEVHRWIYGEGLVTSYLALRRLRAQAPEMEMAELIQRAQDETRARADEIQRIGHGYLRPGMDLPGELRAIFETAGGEGFEAHQQAFAEDAAFRDWVLRPNYLDIDAAYAHPELRAPDAA